MLGERERMKEAYKYLRDNFGVHTQDDVANRMNYSRSVVNQAFNGKPESLTEKFVESMNRAFNGVFNEKYLLTGEGTLLAPEEEDIIRNVRRGAEPAVGAIIELYAQLIKEVEAYRAKLKGEIATTSQLIKEVEAYRAELKGEIATTHQLNQELRTTLRELRDDSDRHYSMAAEG